ncbi:hypothetical protein JHK82_022686 [Glycine max]|nr:hypothetical protein JHK86_022709 [Glycine max]KAG5137955.1 hypothetical protein JHK82_022686 [Glycine max]
MECHRGGGRLDVPVMSPTPCESSTHIFLFCDVAPRIWNSCYQWLSAEFATVSAFSLVDHFGIHSDIGSSKLSVIYGKLFVLGVDDHWVSYLIPLFAVTGAVLVYQTQWENGFHAQAAEIIAGKWLKIWIDFGAVLSAIGLFEAQLSSSAYQILGMAEIGILSKLFGVRSKWFHTPWLGILVSTIITIGVSYMDFTNIISSANFLYSLGMLLEFASFLWLRWKSPSIKRPYRVPLKLPLLVVMCLVPSGFLVLIMVIATKTVYLVSGVMSVAGIGFFLFIKLCKRKKWVGFEQEKDDGFERDNVSSLCISVVVLD